MSAGATPPDGTPVAFQVLSGANTDRWAGSFTNGEAKTSRTEPLAGTDTIYAFYFDASDNEIDSNTVTVTWINQAWQSIHTPQTEPVELSGGTSTQVVGVAFDTNGQRAAQGTLITLGAISGPDVGRRWTVAADIGGESWTPWFTDLTPGVDTFQASFTDKIGALITSRKLTITWDGTQQSITFAQPTGGEAGGPPVPLVAIVSSGLAVSFTSGSPGVCTILGSVALPVRPGICSITAHQAGNPTTYPAPTVTQTFTVSPGPTLRPGQTTLPVGTSAPGVSMALGSMGPVVSPVNTGLQAPASAPSLATGLPSTTTDTGIPAWLVVVLIVMALVIGVLATGLAFALRRGR